MGRINILKEETIGKIAAGEVVERPASVVKELIENSIDASSTSIEIEIESAGQTLIRIADDGEGMSPDDVRIACSRHTTSKIERAEDIDSIRTLGFRGEALASIAAVSQMDIITRTRDEEAALYLYLESGQIQREKPAPRTVGTTIEVRNLFYNVPARKKFMKKEATELSEIVGVVSKFVLSNPDIEFKLKVGDRTLIDAPKGMSLKERIKTVLGTDAEKSMMNVNAFSGDYMIKGFTSLPAETRKDKKRQIFFLNGRYVKNRALNDALYSSYRSLLERGRYPSSVLFVNMPPEEVDVNVHPTKLEVKFRNEKAVKELLAKGVEESFQKIKKETASPTPEKEEASRTPVLSQLPDSQGEFDYADTLQEDQGVGVNRPIASFSGEGVETVGELFQAGGCYIVRRVEDGISITDQHAAHERIYYEYFTKASQSSKIELQNLLFPVRIDLSREEALLIEKLLDEFRKLGFEVENFGGNSFSIQAVPAILKERDVKTVFLDMVSDLVKVDLRKTDPVEEMIKIASCRAAVKRGDKLTLREMEDLLLKLEECELPFTCPHGRPVTYKITLEEMEKTFRRK